MTIVLSGLMIVTISFLIAMALGFEEGGFIMLMVIGFAILGVIKVATMEPIKEEVAVVEQVVEKPAVEKPKTTETPASTVKSLSTADQNCTVFGRVAFECVNRVSIGGEDYTVLTTCDRDPYDGTMECTAK